MWLSSGRILLTGARQTCICSSCKNHRLARTPGLRSTVGTDESDTHEGACMAA